MKKLKTIISSIIIAIFIISVTNAENFDPEVISQLSKNIAERKLMSAGESEIQGEQMIYVSSSLKGMVEQGRDEKMGFINGLVAFGDNYEIRSQTRQWELDAGLKMSNKYMQPLTKPPYPSVITSTSNRTAIYGMGQNVAREYGQRGAQIFSSGTTIIGATSQASGTFSKTVDYVGKSMQIMNPPVYLQNNPELGQFAKFTPSSQKILGVPTSGTWEGHGSYSIPGGSVRYKETLQTSGQYPIIRTHTDWVTTNFGNYYRHTEICTPAANNFERFVVSRYPTGSYWDPNTSYSHTVKQSQISYRYENIRGVERITPLPSPGVGRWNYSQTSWSIPRSSWTIPRTNYSFPKTNFSIPKTNYNFNHRY